MPTRLVMHLGDVPLLAVVESTAYFLIAQVVGNAVKHAYADALTVELARTDEWLRVEVTDDGMGGARVGGGSGLRGLKDRVDAVGGRLHLVSASGAGTRVVAELSCAPDDAGDDVASAS